jgi:hypothetical protein
MNTITFLILALATWRVSYMLVNEDGPYAIVANFRQLLGVRYDDYSQVYGISMPGKLLTCVYCTSVWVSLAYVIIWLVCGSTVSVAIALPFALSAVAVIVNNYIDKQ